MLRACVRTQCINVKNPTKHIVGRGTQCVDLVFVQGVVGVFMNVVLSLSLSLLFGKGACFVEDPDYVHNGYTFDAGGGDYAMLLCRILDGNVDERTSDSSIKHPAVGHHSVRGAVRGNQYAYILYEHYRSYPRVPLFVWRGRTWLHTKSES